MTNVFVTISQAQGVFPCPRLGIFHTLVSVLPIGFGLVAFARDGKIDLKTRAGKFYLVTMFIGSISAFGFIPRRGSRRAGAHFRDAGFAVRRGPDLSGRVAKPGYVQSLSLTASYLLLWVFTTTETLTRLPKATPSRPAQRDPALLPVRLVLLAFFMLAVGLQVRAVRVEAVRVR